MKLWKKMFLILMAALTACLGICGGAVLCRTTRESLRQEKMHDRQQLRIVSDSLRRSVDEDELTQMSEVVGKAYLQFQFQRCCGDGYALLQDGNPVANLTDFEILDAGAMEGEIAVQKLGKRRILLLRQELENWPGYEIMSAQDISAIYVQTGEQAAFAGTLSLFVLSAAGGLLFFLIRRALKPLKELEEAAREIGAGDLKRRAAVTSQDEIGQVGGAFNRMAGQVEAQVEDLRLLLGALTHEIKTPMTAVIGYSDSLLHVNLKEEQREQALRYIYSEGKRLEQLGGKLMSLLGMYDNCSISLEWITAEELFGRVGRAEEPHMKRRGILLSVNWEPGLEFCVDRELMVSLLGNLIRNSVNASRDGAVIELKGAWEGIEVSDDGCGIPEQEIGNVTKAFYMVDKSRSRKAGGAGLGLALGERIAKLHGGTLAIESRVGEGTRVRVILPEVYKRFTKR